MVVVREQLTRREYLAGSAGLALLGCDQSRNWISNRIGPIRIADANGDGYDDCVAWFTNFDQLQRIRLTIIDGRSGDYHYSVESGASREVALMGTRLVTATDTSHHRGMVLPPRIELSDLRKREVIVGQRMPSGVSGLYLDGDSVLAKGSGGEAFRVDLGAGTIGPYHRRGDAEPTPARIVDTSDLQTVTAEEPAALARQLEWKAVRGRALGVDGWLLTGTHRRTEATMVALLRAGEPVWTHSFHENDAGVPTNAVENEGCWLLYRFAAGAARLTALDRSSGNLVWEAVLGKAAFEVTAMAAGRDLVGLVRPASVSRDELLLVDIATRRVTFRLRRG